MADDDTKKPDIDDDEAEKPGFSDEDDEPKTSVETVDGKKAQRESQPSSDRSPEAIAAKAKSGDDEDDEDEDEDDDDDEDEAKAKDPDDDDDADDGDGKARDSEDDEDDDDEVAAKPSPARSDPPPPKKPSDDHGHGAHDHGFGHVVSIPLLGGILGTLLVLTVVTVLASKVDLGAQLNLVVALIIATVKAALVVTFFMHLLWDKRFNTLVFLSSIFFMVLFLAIAMTDRREYQHLIEAREAAQAAQK
jgi:cytochrome c oxidase subunit IV